MSVRPCEIRAKRNRLVQTTPSVYRIRALLQEKPRPTCRAPSGRKGIGARLSTGFLRSPVATHVGPLRGRWRLAIDYTYETVGPPLGAKSPEESTTLRLPERDVKDHGEKPIRGDINNAAYSHALTNETGTFMNHDPVLLTSSCITT